MPSQNCGKVFLVHLIFYGIQFSLAVLSFVVIFYNWDPRAARFLREREDLNVVGENPGLSFRPKIEGSSVIWYRRATGKDHYPWVKRLDEFLKDYREPGLINGRESRLTVCDYDHPPPPGKVCDIDLRWLGPCVSENNYNYDKGAPCVFLRLNTLHGWKPAFYDADSLPEEMPSDLKAHIADSEYRNHRYLNTVWVSCGGEDPIDAENIGPIQYFPSRGFPGYSVQNTDVEGFLSPVIAVFFERPKIGVPIRIKCKLWARNIEHDNDSSLGGVSFDLMVDD